MAKGMERVQRLTGEAFQRIRNDHEQFLEAYEKPTQIYRLLKTRQMLKPLFLYRNLSYMPRRSKKHRRSKFRKKLRVNDLITHTKDIKPDLASEIKSDNHLRISFMGIEQGISFQGLMGDAGSDVSGMRTRGPPPSDDVVETRNGSDVEMLKKKMERNGRKKLEHGQLMEVELLLFKFKQSSIHLSEGSRPYSCSSLGKQVVRFRDPSSSKDDGLSQCAGTCSNKQGMSITIPESVLTWKEDRMMGTQMLVFRATYTKKTTSKPKRMPPLQLINFVSSKGRQNNVVVEVNRLNLSDIGPKNKTAVTDSRTKDFPLSRNDDSEQPESGYPADATCDIEMKVDQEECDSSQQQQRVHCFSTQVISNGVPVVNNCVAEKLNPISNRSFSEKMATNSMLESATLTPKGKISLSKHGLSQKKSKCKVKKAKMDASVMTEISFGTGIITDMSTTISQVPLSTTNDHNSQNDHSSGGGVFISPSWKITEQALSKHNSNHTLSPPTSGIKFKDKCTSPKMLFRNGSLNGLSQLNGYAIPEVVALKESRSVVSKTSKYEAEHFPPNPQQDVTSLRGASKGIGRGGGGSGGDLTDSSKLKRFKKKHKYPAGSGKRGTRSFLVSVPRVHYDSQLKRSNLDSHGVDIVSQQSEELGIRSNPQHRRRSEIQLLLDGDKPRGQRISATDIPIFTAEDISNRASRTSSTGLSSAWLGSSTRKITPVEHFAYPLSPTKRGTSNNYNGESDINYITASTNHSGGIAPSSPTAASYPHDIPSSSNPRKRNGNGIDMPSPESSSPDHPPPAKHPKVTTTQFNSVEILDEEEMVGGSDSNRHLGLQALEEEEEDREKEGRWDPKKVAVPSPEVPSTAAGAAASPLHNSSKPEDDHQNQEVFSAELVVFDSRGECLIGEGEYSILMQNSYPRGEEARRERLTLSSFEPLTWNTIFGDGNSTKESDQFSECPNLLLKFSVSWLKGPPQHRLCSQLETALDLKKIREEYYRPLTPTSPAPSSLLTNPSTSHGKQKPPPCSSRPQEEGTANDRETFHPEEMSVTLTDEGNYLQQQALSPIIRSNQLPPQKVLFNFLYANNALQQTELREDLACPWCGLSCGKLYSLLKHMSLSHPRFHFTYTSNEDGQSVIDVHVNKMYNAGSSLYDRDPGERSNISLIQWRKGPSKCLSCSAVLVERHTEVKEDLSEFFNDGSWKRGYNANRVYYHSRSNLPLTSEEIEVDSEEELQTLEWQNISSQKMIDEFTDVNQGEKDLMKLWNLFSLEKRIIAEKQVPQACLKFVTENGKEIIERALVPNFLSHLVSLFDYGLISPAIVKESMRVIHELEVGVS